MIVNNISIQDKQNTLISDANETPKAKPEQPRFQDVLNSQISARQAVQFSKHAFTRLNARNINFTKEQLNRVHNGIDEAKQRGIQDSLVLVDGVALVVNVRSNTVITAMNPSLKNETIFTNIDGAVIV